MSCLNKRGEPQESNMNQQTYTNPTQSLGFLLHQAALNWRRALARELRDVDLTPVQFFMLGSTSRLTKELGQGPTQKDVAGNTLVDINVISQVVRQLESRGLLIRDRDSSDKRAYRLSLSEDGRRTLQQAIQVVHGVDERFFLTIKPETLTKELGRLV